MINNLLLVYSNKVEPIHTGLFKQVNVFHPYNHSGYFNINNLNTKEINPFPISHFGDYKSSSFPYHFFKLAKRNNKKIKSN